MTNTVLDALRYQFLRDCLFTDPREEKYILAAAEILATADTPEALDRLIDEQLLLLHPALPVSDERCDEIQRKMGMERVVVNLSTDFMNKVRTAADHRKIIPMAVLRSIITEWTLFK